MYLWREVGSYRDLYAKSNIENPLIITSSCSSVLSAIPRCLPLLSFSLLGFQYLRSLLVSHSYNLSSSFPSDFCLFIYFLAFFFWAIFIAMSCDLLISYKLQFFCDLKLCNCCHITAVNAITVYFFSLICLFSVIFDYFLCNIYWSSSIFNF